MRYAITRSADIIFGDKHPTYKKDFIKKNENKISLSFVDTHYIKRVYDKFFKYKQLCLENNISPIITKTRDYQNNGDYNFEELEDKIVTVINKNKAINLGKSVLRGYYKKLKNAETDDLLFSFITNGLEKEQLQKGISKVAALQSSEELNNVIRKIIKENGYTKEKLIKEVEDYNNQNLKKEFHHSHVEHVEEGDIVILNIKDYFSSEYFGSPQWCISYDESLFNEYMFKTPTEEEQVHGRGNSLFFIFDFSKSVDDPMFKTSPLFSTNGQVLDVFDQNDNDISIDFEKNLIHNKTLLNFLEKDINERKNNVLLLDDLEIVMLFLENESYDPIEELFEIIKEYESDFFEQQTDNDISYNEIYSTIEKWKRTPYASYIICKYPEKYLKLSEDIDSSFNEHLFNPNNKNRISKNIKSTYDFLNQQENINEKTKIDKNDFKKKKAKP